MLKPSKSSARALTANGLLSGRTLFWHDGAWRGALEGALVAYDAKAQEALAEVGRQAEANNAVVGAYLIDVLQAPDGPLRPSRFREQVRVDGPTVGVSPEPTRTVAPPPPCTNGARTVAPPSPCTNGARTVAPPPPCTNGARTASGLTGAD